MKFAALLFTSLLLGGDPLARAQPGSDRPGLRSGRIAPVQRFRFDAGAALMAPAGVAAEDGTLCVGTVDGYIHSLNPDGSYRWSHSVRGAVARRPLHVGKLWYVATSAERVYALNADGSLNWVFKPPSPVDSELAADASGNTYFVAADHFLYGLSVHGGVILRAPFGELKAGPSSARDGGVWAENQAGSLTRTRARELYRFGAGARPDFAFPEPERLHDPAGHVWRARSDGSIEFSDDGGSATSVIPITSSPLLDPVWSDFANYAVFSARSGLVIALAPVALRSSR